MAWRLAKSLMTLRNQVNDQWPKRSKSSDGTIGDAAHASRSSDHNPWIKDAGYGVVSGMDLTHDPKSGFDSEAFAQMLIRNRDPRLKYVISNRKIASGSEGPQPWVWRKYTGKNPHDHHCHISVKSTKVQYDSEAPWNLRGVNAPPPVSQDSPSAAPAAFVDAPATLKQGSKGDLVKALQAGIGAVPDGDFGPKTKIALQKFQVDHGLVGDGIAGPQTWKLISQPKGNLTS